MVKRLPAMQERPGFNPWLGKIPWRRQWPPSPVLLPRKFHGWKTLVGYSPWGLKQSDMTERLHFLFFLSCVFLLGKYVLLLCVCVCVF